MSDTENSEPTTQLKVIPLVMESYRTVFTNLGDMARMLWLIITLNVVFGYFQFSEMQSMQSGGLGSGQAVSSGFTFMMPIVAILNLCLFSGVVVAIQRYAVLGAKPVFPGFGIGKRELRYVGYFLALYILSIFVMTVPMVLFVLLQAGLQLVVGDGSAMTLILSFVLLIAMLIGIVAVITRMGFVMPAIAMDQEGGLVRRFDYALKTAKGHTARMVAALFLALLPWGILSTILSDIYIMPALQQMATAGQLPMTLGAVPLLMINVVWWVGLALGAVMYSLAYRTLEEVRANDVGPRTEAKN